MLNTLIPDFGKIVRLAHYPSSRLSCSCSGSSDNFQVDPDIARKHTGCHDLNDATVPLTACASSTPLPGHPKPVELSCVCSLPIRRFDGKISPLPRPGTTSPQESTHTLYPWSAPFRLTSITLHKMVTGQTFFSRRIRSYLKSTLSQRRPRLFLIFRASSQAVCFLFSTNGAQLPALCG